MRVWAFPSIYPYDYPGMKWNGTFAHRQYKGLIENGAELSVIVPVPWNPPFPFSEIHPQWKSYQKLNYPLQRVYDGITVYHPRIANSKPNRFVKKSYQQRYAETIINFFKEKNIALNKKTDIFYSQWLPESVSVQKTAHQLGIKSAILYIGDDVLVWPKETKENFDAFKDLLSNADMRFSCADYLGKEANLILGTPLPYTVVNWGVDYNFFKPEREEQKILYKKKYKIPENKTIILTIGSPIVRKGWIDLLDALKMLTAHVNDFMLVGVTAGHKELNLDEEAEKRGLKNFFLNLGEVDPQYLNEVYNAADIFCLPSHWEGLANVNIEAMSAGLPVITTNVCGHPELIKDNFNGILIPPKQTGVLFSKLLEVITNKEFRNSLSQNGRKFILEKWGNFSDNTKHLYQKLNQIE